MNKWLQLVCGITMTVAIILLLAVGQESEIRALSFLGGFCIGLLAIRWIQLEFPEKK
jgi:hypothetical protein